METDSVLQRYFSSTLSAIIADKVTSTVQNGIAVAYSGGLDSSVLLNLAIGFAQEKNLPLFAFHIHHGLSPNADSWLLHCESICFQNGIPFFAVKVNVSKDGKLGLEAGARAARYSALGALCGEHKLSIVLTAHHQDDQAETVMLRLLRGSGVAGLSGMDLYNYAPSLLGSDKLLLARPLLSQSKQALLEYAIKNQISHINDESNLDSRFARNALRQQVMPILAKVSPGYAERMVRSARHAQSAARLLQELAEQDIAKCSLDNALSIDLMRDLSDDRIENILRFWLSTLNVRMPSTARLAEMRSQLFVARHDAKISIAHDGLEIHRFKNKIVFSKKRSAENEGVFPVDFTWGGEPCLYFPKFHGYLHFDNASIGVDSSWLMQQRLSLGLRQGGSG